MTSTPHPTEPSLPEKNDFIRQIIREDLATGRHAIVRTRFPPEPNGYLHIGHAKSIYLNFGIGREFGGPVILRFDDTNPAKEDQEYVEAIKDDVRWLGFQWTELRHASDYFEVFYRSALKLVEDGKAYVCDLDAEQVRQYRGTLTEPGRNSPFRDRTVAENLDLFTRMRAGEFPDGARTLRAKIDIASGNINLRDPAIYRIKHVEHQNTGNAWPIYPMYDYAHCLSDALEGITHSLCTLEFEDHRPLYDWFVDHVDLLRHPALYQSVLDAGLVAPVAKPRQIESSRLNINYTLTSKRKLLALVGEGLVSGWDDPRLPTLQGLRRRGCPPAALQLFADRVGISKQNSLLDYSVLEGCIRDIMDSTCARKFAVLDPLKLIITNLDERHESLVTFPNHPKDAAFGERSVLFSPEIWIEKEDFAEVPTPGFHRLARDKEVRLRGVGLIKCHDIVTINGAVQELRCTLDPDSRPGMPGSKRKVKGTIHWVSAKHAVPAEFRLYDRLFSVPDPDNEDGGMTYRDFLNPLSIQNASGFVERSAAFVAQETQLQFERLGFFVADRNAHASGKPVFNRTVTLRDTWAGKSGS